MDALEKGTPVIVTNTTTGQTLHGVYWGRHPHNGFLSHSFVTLEDGRKAWVEHSQASPWAAKAA